MGWRMSKPDIIKIAVREGGTWTEISGTIANKVMEHQGEKVAVIIIPLHKLSQASFPRVQKEFDKAHIKEVLSAFIDKLDRV